MDGKRILQSAGIVGGLTFVSRLLGLVRDVLMAGFFGTSMAMGGFVIAFMIPNLFRRLFGEGALSAAFVPVFVETRRNHGDEAAWKLARRVISMVALTLTVIALSGVIMTSVVLTGVESGTMLHVVLSLLRTMLPYMIFICLVALCMAILNSFHHFVVPAATSMVLNLVWISALVFLCPHLGETQLDKVKIVAWAVLVAGVLQLAIQYPMLRKHGYRFGLDFTWRDPKVQRVLVLMGPAALGLAVSQVNVIVDKALAAWVGPWAPACLFYSERLIYFPLGVFATALSTVLLPAFSGSATSGDEEEYRTTIRESLCNLLFVMVPAAFGLFVLARPILEMILQWGAFDARSAALTTLSLQAYAPGLIVFSLGKVFVPAFYGMQDTRTPVLVGVGAVALNLVMNLLAVWWWPEGSQHAGLALSTVLSSAAGALVLARLLDRRVGSPGWGRIVRCFVRCVVLSVGMAFAAFLVQHGLAGVLAGTSLPIKLVQIGSVMPAVFVGALLYIVGSACVDAPEWKRVTQALLRRASDRKQVDG